MIFVISMINVLTRKQWNVKQIIIFLFNITIKIFPKTKSRQCWHYYQLCIPIKLQFSSSFAPTDVSNCQIRSQGVKFY